MYIALGVLPERASTWEVVMRLTPAQVCMKSYMLQAPPSSRNRFQTLFKKFFSEDRYRMIIISDNEVNV